MNELIFLIHLKENGRDQTNTILDRPKILHKYEAWRSKEVEMRVVPGLLGRSRSD